MRGAYVHDLKSIRRDRVDIDPPAIVSAETLVATAAARIRARDYMPSPGSRCRSCEVPHRLSRSSALTRGSLPGRIEATDTATGGWPAPHKEIQWRSAVR